MQINSISYPNTLPVAKIHKSLFPPQKDTINFKGTNPKSENIKRAEAFGINIFALSQNNKLTLSNIQKEAKRNLPQIEVRDIKDLKKYYGKNLDISAYNAYLVPEYEKNCKLKNLIMFIPQKKSDIQAIGTITHEYTHALQHAKQADYQGLAPKVHNNLEQARALNSLSAHIFRAIEQNTKLQPVFEEAAEKSEITGRELEETLIEAYECENFKEIKKNFKHLFNSAFDGINGQMRTQKEYKTYMPFQNDPLKLRNTVREAVVARAKREEEAYTAQKNLIQSLDKDGLTAQNKVNPTFYKLIAEALS